ncbi:UNVERIFIED_CONTAM: uncharacterized protein YlxW (UPF0749 family) [Brevibacillus sp. OAP136]
MLGKNHKITFVLTLISAIIGIMLVTQLQSSMNPIKKESRSINDLRITLQKELEKRKNLLADTSKYDQLLYQYETSMTEGESISVMKEELARARNLAGMVSVEGEGIVVKISDRVVDTMTPPPPDAIDPHGPPLVIDEDLRWLVNVLFSNGAKAVSINGNRLISTSAIRNVGEDIQVDTRTIKPPYEIKALGDPDGLISGLKLEGVDSNFQLANKTVVLEKEEKLMIPAFTGARTIQHMKPVNVKGES